MKKTIFKKAFFLLCMLLVGVANAHAKEYMQPRLNIIGYSFELPLLDMSMTVNSDSNDDNVDDFEDLLAKPGIIYDAWEDEDKEIDFHTDV